MKTMAAPNQRRKAADAPPRTIIPPTKMTPATAMVMATVIATRSKWSRSWSALH